MFGRIPFSCLFFLLYCYDDVVAFQTFSGGITL